MDLEGLDIIAEATFQPDDRKYRVKAMFSLWEYLESAKVDIINWKGDKREVIIDIAHQSLRFLFDWYTLTEIYETIKTVSKVFRIELPEDMEDEYILQAIDLAISKIKNPLTYEQHLRKILGL